jgi:hypothetical protein
MKKEVATWGMYPLPKYQCEATFYEDGSAVFFDEPSRHLEYDNKSNVRRLAVGIFEESDRHLADEICAHSYDFKIDMILLNKIIDAKRRIILAEDGDVTSDISPQEEEEIEKELNFIFWRDINPNLRNPLCRD